MNNPNRQEMTGDPQVHVAHVRSMLADLESHIQQDEQLIQDPQALALFETSREVLKGLMAAFDHYAEKSEKAWQH